MVPRDGGGLPVRDPWLDEAFAGHAESAVHPPGDVDRLLALPGDAGAAMDQFPATGAYFQRVYGKGRAALVAAREAAGAEAFDAALRCYVDANACQIATPDDVARAPAELPAALDVLLAAGALEPANLPD